ncbi:cuticle protein CP14.6-like [Trichoplusia ni]|uniref:Cuticle protein CP14.6-like n=1 Tax=Trichoplusia ni TaxID=7111 RepID=A0A7E5WC31_TRINI|nr:cuticle protein CP14.6-like [Trichoplusia ni]
MAGPATQRHQSLDCLSVTNSPRTTKNPSKMKSFIVVALFVAAAVAAPAGPDADAQILRYDSDNIGLDGYNYSVETSNGIKQQEEGQLKNPGTENEALQVRGQFAYTGPDGVVYTITYIADENGFQPQGAHLPVAP